MKINYDSAGYNPKTYAFFNFIFGESEPCEAKWKLQNKLNQKDK